MNYQPLSTIEEEQAKKIVDAAYAVHKKLGPGLLEKIYEICFCHESIFLYACFEVTS
jgi:hypothetical protein